MSDLEYCALVWLRDHPSDLVDSTTYGSSYRPARVTRAVLRCLVDQGLVAARRESEYVRGEGRSYWTAYRLTPAGRAALQSHEVAK